MTTLNELSDEIRACRACADDFAQTHTGHRPRPVAWLSHSAKILIVGQAPGMRVHESGVPFDDRSGDRLRQWMGVDRDTFYDRNRIAILPMAFCFPGYNKSGSDLPPPKRCAELWRAKALTVMPEIVMTLLVGGYAQREHLKTRQSVTQTVADWRAVVPNFFPLPHPSWRNTGWLKTHPWFEADLLPELRRQVAACL